MSLPMLEDQHGSFARNARYFAVSKFIGHEIAEKHDRFSRKIFYPLGKITKVYRGRRCALCRKTLHANCPRIQSAASAKSPATKSGGLGHFAAFHASSPSP